LSALAHRTIGVQETIPAIRGHFRDVFERRIEGAPADISALFPANAETKPQRTAATGAG
jgi:hypothetical protein